MESLSEIKRMVIYRRLEQVISMVFSCLKLCESVTNQFLTCMCQMNGYSKLCLGLSQQPQIIENSEYDRPLWTFPHIYLPFLWGIEAMTFSLPLKQLFCCHLCW